MLLSMKLADGTEILGYRLEEDEQYMHVADALMVVYKFTEDSPTPMLYLQKYSQYTHSYTVKVRKSSIISIVDQLDPQVEIYFRNILLKIKQNFKVIFTDDKEEETEFDDLMSDFYEHSGEVH